MPSLRRAVPRPLAALLGAVFVLALAWALVVPPFQAPDEHYHVGYVQSLVEGPGLPGQSVPSPFSTEQWQAQVAINSDQTAANPTVKPEWSSNAWKEFERQDAHLPGRSRSDGGGTDNRAASNPPLFYLYDAVPYVAASHGSFFARFTAMRVAAALWLLVTVVGAWLLAGELFGRDRLLQLVAAGVVGLLPMVDFISAQVGPDTMMYAWWSLALWLGVRILRRGITLPSAVGLAAVTALAIVTKATSYALLPAALFALTLGAWRIRGTRRQAIQHVAIALAALAVPLLAWFVAAHAFGHPVAQQLSDSSSGRGINVRQLASYLWQYYLPRLPFMRRFPFAEPGLPLYHIWLVQGWGAFGWLETRFPADVYRVLTAITVLVAVLAVARLVATRRQLDLGVALFLALAAVVLLAGLHWTDYRSFVGGTGNVMQGRYLFPLVALAGAGVAQAVTIVSGRTRQAAAGVVLAGAWTLQLFALALVATRFYA